MNNHTDSSKKRNEIKVNPEENKAKVNPGLVEGEIFGGIMVAAGIVGAVVATGGLALAGAIAVGVVGGIVMGAVAVNEYVKNKKEQELVAGFQKGVDDIDKRHTSKPTFLKKIKNNVSNLISKLKPRKRSSEEMQESEMDTLASTSKTKPATKSENTAVPSLTPADPTKKTEPEETSPRRRGSLGL